MSRPTTLAADPSLLGDGRSTERSEVRAEVTRFLLLGLLTLVAISVPVALWIRGQAERHILASATEHTQELADRTVAPLITEQLRAGEPAALRILTRTLAPWLAEGYIVRVKVWDPNGRIIYSDLPSLIGRSFPLPRWSTDLLAGGAERASFGTQREADNEQDYALGELVEINVRSADAAGRPIMFEAYFDDEAVREEQLALTEEITPVFAVSLLALQLAQLLPATRLARRIQADQASRRRLLQHAIAASDYERRRIARELHDEVIQDLAGLSYAFAAEETHGPPGERPLFGRARSILQRNLGTLRGMTTELYPPDFALLGLTKALLGLTAPLAGQGIEAIVSLPERIELDRDRAAMLYRVAREALANTVKHAGACVVELALVQNKDRTTLTVRDNGRGFDPDSPSPDGHLGLRIMRDTVRVVGGDLVITSRMGEGTTVVATLPRV